MAELSSRTATRHRDPRPERTATRLPAIPTSPTPDPPAPVVPDLGRGRQPYGVLVRARSLGGVYDIVVYRDALLFARSTGTDPAFVGALVGALVGPVVGAVVGAWAGERIARRSAAKRVHALCFAPPEEAFARSRRNRFVRASNVRGARLMKFGRRQLVLEIRLRDGGRFRMTLGDHLQSNALALETLRIPLGTRLRVERHGVRAASVAMGALIGIAAVLSTALVLHSLLP